MPTLPGQLSNAVSKVRNNVNEAGITAKYPAHRVVELIGLHWTSVVQDINTAMRDPLYAEATLTFNTTDLEYLIPTGVGGVSQIAILDATTGLRTALLPSHTIHHVRGPNFLLAPPWIRFITPWIATQDVVVSFVPKGNEYMHEATITNLDTGLGADFIVLSLTPTLGYFDARPNAYVGGMVRLIASNESLAGYFPIQERRITAYDRATRRITVNVPWSFGLLSEVDDTDTITYEIVPMVDPVLMEMAALRASKYILMIEGSARKAAGVEAAYQELLTTARREYSEINRVRDPSPENKLDTVHRSRRGGSLPGFTHSILGP